MKILKQIRAFAVSAMVLCVLGITSSKSDLTGAAFVRFYALQMCGSSTPREVNLYVSSLHSHRQLIRKQPLAKLKNDLWSVKVRIPDGAYQFFAVSPRCTAMGNVFITGAKERRVTFLMKPEIVLASASPTIYGRIAIRGVNVAAVCEADGSRRTIPSRSDGSSYSIDLIGDESSCKIVVIFGNFNGVLISKHNVWSNRRKYVRLDITNTSRFEFRQYSLK